MVMRDVPIGIQDFKEIRDNGYYFVDKSDLIVQILEKPATKAFLFTRPRRFGKSLNLSMMDAFLNIRYAGNTWFDGLSVSARKDLESRKNSFPVVCFDFKDLNVDTYDSFLAGMANKIADLYRVNSVVLEDIQDPKLRKDSNDLRMGTSGEDVLSRSIRTLTVLMQEHYGSKAVVLIDEYDNPIHSAYGKDDFERILNFMKIMMGSLLKGNESLHFAVITGVMQITKESIFSGLNNLSVNNILSRSFDEMFGFTSDEVRRLCEDHGHPEKYDEAKDWYDGYCFGDAEIYNPWSVLNYVDSGFRPYPYWAGTSGNSIIEDLLDSADPDTYRALQMLGSGQSISRRIDPTVTYHGLDKDRTAIYSMMVMTGYLTAVPNEYDYDIRIPNREMYGEFAKFTLAPLDSTVVEGMNRFTNALVRNDTATMEGALYDIFDQILGFRLLDHEKDYQLFITGMLLTLAGRYRVTADKESGNGFHDLLMECRDGRTPNIVFEFKRRRERDPPAEEMARRALDQIRRKDYAHGLRGDTILYGVVFDSKAPVILSDRISL